MKHIRDWAQTMIGQSVEDVPMEAVIDLHGYLNHLAAAILKDEQEQEPDGSVEKMDAALARITQLRRDLIAVEDTAKSLEKSEQDLACALASMTDERDKAVQLGSDMEGSWHEVKRGRITAEEHNKKLKVDLTAAREHVKELERALSSITGRQTSPLRSPKNPPPAPGTRPTPTPPPPKAENEKLREASGK